MMMLVLAVLAWPGPGRGTELGIEGSRFTLDGKPAFLLGCSYYGGLGAPPRFVRQDLDDLRRLGFRWVRVWATWQAFGDDVSAVGRDGAPREPFLGRLRRLVTECDRRGMVVDVTLSRGELLPDLAAHRRAVVTLVRALQPYRNWYLDLANERNVRDARYVSFPELRLLRDEAKRLDGRRLVTASAGGDIGREQLASYLVQAGLDFLAPHRPRGADSPAQTAATTRDYLAALEALDRTVPVHYQEPFRRGYQPRHWEPAAADFQADLAQARAGGAAGWCLHNGQQADGPDQRPRRCFDLRRQRLLDQLDAEERRFLGSLPQG